MVRIATHSTEADVSRQHITAAKEMGLEVVGFLMMAHMVEPDKLLEQAKLMESYGADIIYATDSAGALLPDQVRDRIELLVKELDVAVGFHGHNNLGLAMANTLTAAEAGATYLDGSVRALGAGAGNTQTEVMISVLEKSGYETGVELFKLMDVAEDLVAPIIDTPQIIDRDSLTLGHAGVYSSFKLFAQRSGKRFGIDSRDILVELGKLKVVGGQEDMVEDVAAGMAAAKK